MAKSGSNGTPLLDELEKGPWPSFVTQIKEEAAKNDMCKDLLALLERSYREKIGHWKHGGIVGVLGYGGGVIGRYNDLPEEYPNIAHFHTLRVNMPSGWFYTAEVLRKVCDIWERHGSGLTNMHGSTGDIILLGTTTDQLEPTFKELTEAGFDLGGSGSAVRTPSGCVGPARCEWACYDTLDLTNDLTHTFQDELHRPGFPYKFKFKCSGCPNDCVASIARADMSIIGTWRDDIKIDQAEVRAAAKAGLVGLAFLFAVVGFTLGIRARRAEGRLQPLPDAVHGLGRQDPHDRQRQLRQVHALHQRDAQGAAAGR